MTALDIKDRKILYELDLNARQSLTQIGKKVGLKKDVVSYRLKRLQDEGIIKNFWTAINTFKLGYLVFRIYITFQYVNQNVKNEIIQKFVDYKNSWTVYSTIRSEVDLGVIVWVKNIYEFYKFWEDILDEYEDYFEKSVVSIYTRAVCYKKSYLIPDITEKSNRKMYMATSGEPRVTIDKIDYSLLNEIAINARIPLIELADRLGYSSQTIKYRISNLIKKGVIQAFRVNLDIKKLELQKYKADIYLKKHKRKKEIIEYLEKKPYFEGLNLVVGWADIEPEFIVKNVKELNQILAEIDNEFPNSIKKQNYWIAEENYKERWLPEIY
jgi:Lrp/AsnC family leucine-responsive transcriptional regulator